AVTEWLSKQGRGFRIGEAVVPIVPSAILFDLNNGGDKDWGDSQPYRRLAGLAMESAGEDFSLGNSGAGLGATAGPLKGGLGSASVVNDDGVTVGAVVAVNSFGSVTMPDSPVFWAWPFEQNNEFGGLGCNGAPDIVDLDYEVDLSLGANTTLAVVATDMTLSKAQAQRVAIMAHDGFARAIRPVHTPVDGDTVFVISTARKPLADPVADLTKIGMMAADVVARSIARGVFEADSIGDIKDYRSL
ncbi:MAG TPA: peptidase T4, partial [Rhodospirillales bacterium]|nr:peptidase T4 [Rhodospirillales bacterium]